MHLDVCGLEMNKNTRQQISCCASGEGREASFPLGCGCFFLPLERNYGYLASSWDRNRICLSVLWYFGEWFCKTTVPFYHLMMKLKTKWKRLNEKEDVCSLKMHFQWRLMKKCDNDPESVFGLPKLRRNWKVNGWNRSALMEPDHLLADHVTCRHLWGDAICHYLAGLGCQGAEWATVLNFRGRCWGWPRVCFLLEGGNVCWTEILMMSLHYPTPWKLGESEKNRNVEIMTRNTDSFNLSIHPSVRLIWLGGWVKLDTWIS